MSNRSGSPYSAPRDANRTPTLLAASTADGITPVSLEANPSTGALIVETVSSGGASVNLTQVGGSAITLGQTTMSASLPVAVASDNNLAQESGGNLATLITTLQSLIDYMADVASYQNALPYARDPSQQMLVNIASGTVTILDEIAWAAANLDASYYGTGSPNSMDMRDMQRVNNNMANNIDRNLRWIFS